MIYGIIENNICINVIVADRQFAQSLGAVEVPEGYGIGDGYKNGKWINNKIIPDNTKIEGEDL